MRMRTSEAGLELIVRFEGLRLAAYDDGYGTCTIGCGHTGPDVHLGLAITRAQAMELLRADVRGAEGELDRLVHKPLNQCQFDALVSLVFNAGALPLTSTLGAKLNAGDYAGAALEFAKWNKANVHGHLEVSAGLVRRRAAEEAMFRAEPTVHDLTRWLTTQEREWTTEYDALVHAGREGSPQGELLKREMTRQRKAIWRLAQPKDKGGDGNGWHFRHRVERYRSLALRTGVPVPSNVPAM